MMKKSGFTLAEVLITLGIIGVVAAMTIPNLIANTNGAKFRSQFKKTLSTLNQAGLMAQAQYDFDFAGTTGNATNAAAGAAAGAACVDGAKDHPEVVMTMCAILNGTLTGQSYVESADKLTRNANGEAVNYAWLTSHTLGTPDGYIAYTLADGSIVGFKDTAVGCELPIGTPLDKEQVGTGKPLNKCLGFIDVNGVTLPNREVSCSDNNGKPVATALTPETPCMVKNDAKSMTDVFPIVFHDATVEAASNASKYILVTAK